MTLELLSTDFSKYIQIQNFVKIRPVITEFLHADKLDKINSRFSQFRHRVNKGTLNGIRSLFVDWVR